MITERRTIKSTFIARATALCLAWAMLTNTASGYSRAHVPTSVAVAIADAIVIAKATKVPANPYTGKRETAEIEVTEVLKGKVGQGRVTVQLNPMHTMAMGALKADAEYVFFLSPQNDAQSLGYEVMLDGTQLHSDKEAESIRFMVAQTPAWSAPKDGISACLVTDTYRFKKDQELTLYVVLRNVTDQQITLTYNDWPLATHSWWELEVTPEGSQQIAPLKHPTLTEADINDYFGKFHRTYDVPLEPHQAYGHFHIQRVNSAEPGWGYKEEIDFKYYPMEKPGSYSIKAKAHHFGKDITTSELKVTVE